MPLIRGYNPAPHRQPFAAGWHDIELLSNSAALGWERVGFYMVRGQVRDAREVMSPGHLVAVNLAGTCSVDWTRGRRSLRRDVGPGAVSVFPALHQHKFSTDAGVDSLAWVIQPAALQRVAERELKRAPSCLTLCERLAVEDPALARLGSAFLNLVDGPAGPHEQLRAEEILAQVVYRVLRCSSSAASLCWAREGCLSARRYERVIALMHELSSDELSLERLASEANLSPFHFLRGFKRLTRQTPHQFLIRLRVERAQQLLAESSMNLAEVALRAGFSSQSHMTSILSRETGCTPSALRMVLRA